MLHPDTLLTSRPPDLRPLCPQMDNMPLDLSKSVSQVQTAVPRTPLARRPLPITVSLD